MEELKISIYDKFKCTADKCKYTCCEGWDIEIDKDTYCKWSKDETLSKELDRLVKEEDSDKGKSYYINKEIEKSCPLLDKKGLCKVVKDKGDDYLSLTCKSFPRVKNSFADRTEILLSAACPEVINLIEKEREEDLITKEFLNLEQCLELKVRAVILRILEEETINLDIRLMVIFEMLTNLIDEKNIVKELEKFKSTDYIKEYGKAYEEVDLDRDESVEEINYLFLDIIENYKDVSGLKSLLEGIADFGDNAYLEDLTENWDDFKEKFDYKNSLIEKIIKAKVISSCVNEDIREIAIAFQLIILEYLLTRYAVYLEYLQNEREEIKVEIIKNYIMTFSRVIGNNKNAVLEFIEEGFEDELLEVGYLGFIALF